MSWKKAEAMLYAFPNHHQRWARGIHIAVHQKHDELFRYLVLHFQVFKTIQPTVLWLNPYVLITELPKHEQAVWK